MYLPVLWCPLSQAAGAHPWEWDGCSNQLPSRLVPCCLCPSVSQRGNQSHEVGSPLSSSALPPSSGSHPEGPDDGVYLTITNVTLQSATDFKWPQKRNKTLMCEQSGKNDNTFLPVTDFKNRLLKEMMIFLKNFFTKEEKFGLHSEQYGPFTLILLQERQHKEAFSRIFY